MEAAAKPRRTAARRPGQLATFRPIRCPAEPPRRARLTGPRVRRVRTGTAPARSGQGVRRRGRLRHAGGDSSRRPRLEGAAAQHADARARGSHRLPGQRSQAASRRHRCGQLPVERAAARQQVVWQCIQSPGSLRSCGWLAGSDRRRRCRRYMVGLRSRGNTGADAFLDCSASGSITPHLPISGIYILAPKSYQFNASSSCSSLPL